MPLALSLVPTPVAPVVRNSKLFNGRVFGLYLDQGLKTTDDVVFSSCKADHKSSDGSLGATEQYDNGIGTEFYWKDGILYYAG